MKQDRVLWLFMAVVAMLHGLVAARYDFFRNELYFIVCGRHPDFGYVDQPPLIPLLSAATQLFGNSLWLLRLPAVLAAVLILPLTAALARKAGGEENVSAAWFAGGAVALSAGLNALTATFTTSTLEPLAWTALAWLLVRAVLAEDRRALIWCGVAAGLAMEAKYGVAMWIIGLLAGLLATPQRRLFLWREAWIGAAIATLLAAPSLIWQAAHGWPFFTAVFDPAVAGRPFLGTPWRFALQQALAINPVLAPLWLAGLILPFTRQRMAKLRFLPIAALVAAVIDYAGGGKDYYLFPVYPTLLALGAAGWRPSRAWKPALWLAAALLLALPVLPITLPVLSPNRLAQRLDHSHLRPPPNERAAVGAPLTQMFSDELGWHELEQQVAGIYRSLPEEDRAKAVLMASNYGEAAALDFFGKEDGLPPAIATENQYYQWGPRGAGTDLVIHVGGSLERWRAFCQSVELAATFGVPLAMPYERDRPIFLCRGLRKPLGEVWPALKRG